MASWYHTVHTWTTWGSLIRSGRPQLCHTDQWSIKPCVSDLPKGHAPLVKSLTHAGSRQHWGSSAASRGVNFIDLHECIVLTFLGQYPLKCCFTNWFNQTNESCHSIRAAALRGHFGVFCFRGRQLKSNLEYSAFSGLISNSVHLYNDKLLKPEPDLAHSKTCLASCLFSVFCSLI